MTDLKEYSRWCGPAALASAMGAPRLTAARLLDRVKQADVKRSGCHVTYMSVIAEVMDFRVETYAHYKSGELVRLCSTMAQWMRAHPRADAILRVSHHFIHVRRGEVLEDNGHHKIRGRVTHAIFISEELNKK